MLSLHFVAALLLITTLLEIRLEISCGEGQTEGTTCICDAAAGAHSALGARGPWRRD